VDISADVGSTAGPKNPSRGDVGSVRSWGCESLLAAVLRMQTACATEDARPVQRLQRDRKKDAQTPESDRIQPYDTHRRDERF
jgi:hypothetical protein